MIKNQLLVVCPLALLLAGGIINNADANPSAPATNNSEQIAQPSDDQASSINEPSYDDNFDIDPGQQDDEMQDQVQDQNIANSDTDTGETESSPVSTGATSGK